MAGERVVLAVLDIDETGAVRKVLHTKDAFESLGKTTHSTSQIFTNRMFSMRSAAQAFLGGFTLAGAILGLKNFATEIAKTDTAFAGFTEAVKKANEATQEFFRPFVHGGLVAATDAINSISGAVSSFFSIFSSSYESMGPKSKAAFWTFMALLGLGGAAKSALGLNESTKIPGAPELIGPPGPQGYQQREINPRYAPGLEPKMAERVFDWPERHIEDLGEITYAYVGLESVVLKAGEAYASFRNEQDLVHETNITAASDLEDKVIPLFDELSAKFTIASSAAMLFGDAMAAALFTAGTSLKEAMGEALMGLARTMAAYALTALAMGAMASTPWGFAIFGEPSGYFKAAALFGVAAAGAFAAASALGAGRGGSAAGASGGASVAAAGGGGGGNVYHINVAVEGSGNPDIFGRRAALSIKRALADGAAGGGF